MPPAEMDLRERKNQPTLVPLAAACKIDYFPHRHLTLHRLSNGTSTSRTNHLTTSEPQQTNSFTNQGIFFLILFSFSRAILVRAKGRRGRLPCRLFINQTSLYYFRRQSQLPIIHPFDRLVPVQPASF